MIHSTIPFHSITAHLHCQVRSIGSRCLQNGCQLHYHTADSVLTSGCSCICQQIWIKIFIALAILGRCIKIEIFSARKRSVYIHISGWHTIEFRGINCLSITGWHRWRSGQMWHCVWCRLSELLWWRCTHALAPPAYLGILCCDILAR